VSHISKIELEINDLEALKSACKNLGFNFMENQKTYKWFGTWVGDTPLPEGVSVEELGKCTHAIHVPAAQYEIGLVQKGSKYNLLWDYWFGGGLEKHIGKNACKLKQAYTLEIIRKGARLKGYLIHETKIQNGIRMTLTQSR
jgi:hypothetical protein